MPQQVPPRYYYVINEGPAQSPATTFEPCQNSCRAADYILARLKGMSLTFEMFKSFMVYHVSGSAKLRRTSVAPRSVGHSGLKYRTTKLSVWVFRNKYQRRGLERNVIARYIGLMNQVPDTYVCDMIFLTSHGIIGVVAFKPTGPTCLLFQRTTYILSTYVARGISWRMILPGFLLLFHFWSILAYRFHARGIRHNNVNCLLRPDQLRPGYRTLP